MGADAGGQEQRVRAGQVELRLDAGRPDHGADRADLPGGQREVQFPDLAEQPFIDLAVVFAPMSLVGSLVFARLMERDL